MTEIIKFLFEIMDNYKPEPIKFPLFLDYYELQHDSILSKDKYELLLHKRFQDYLGDTLATKVLAHNELINLDNNWIKDIYMYSQHSDHDTNSITYVFSPDLNAIIEYIVRTTLDLSVKDIMPYVFICYKVFIIDDETKDTDEYKWFNCPLNRYPDNVIPMPTYARKELSKNSLILDDKELIKYLHIRFYKSE